MRSRRRTSDSSHVSHMSYGAASEAGRDDSDSLSSAAGRGRGSGDVRRQNTEMRRRLEQLKAACSGMKAKLEQGDVTLVAARTKLSSQEFHLKKQHQAQQEVTNEVQKGLTALKEQEGTLDACIAQQRVQIRELESLIDTLHLKFLYGFILQSHNVGEIISAGDLFPNKTAADVLTREGVSTTGARHEEGIEFVSNREMAGAAEYLLKVRRQLAQLFTPAELTAFCAQKKVAESILLIPPGSDSDEE